MKCQQIVKGLPQPIFTPSRCPNPRLRLRRRHPGGLLPSSLCLRAVPPTLLNPRRATRVQAGRPPGCEGGTGAGEPQSAPPHSAPSEAPSRAGAAKQASVRLAESRGGGSNQQGKLFVLANVTCIFPPECRVRPQAVRAECATSGSLEGRKKLTTVSPSESGLVG
ncbi:hypothetical protein ZEAMMB73_Zm00001d028836 [Zea mays]|uniref:Uncharacterized protein n=1 Tax=Zea mays TaxID=4577 RepID=A0A1D6K045_MAIZE|nr:hypothetical protein ZEAMMB73_Zm00001d028836 [Zea mays]